MILSSKRLTLCLIKLVKVWSRTKKLLQSVTHRDDNVVDMEDVLVGLHSSQQADKVKAPCDELGDMRIIVITHSCSGLEEKQTASTNDEVPAKELLVSVELDSPKKSSTLE